MADTLKTLDITSIPETDSTKGLQTMGVSRDILEFDKTKTYYPEDIVKYTVGDDVKYYQFLSCHNIGEIVDSEVKSINTPELSNVIRADLSFITDRLERISDLTKTTGYSFSGNNLHNTIDFTVYVKGRDSAFDNKNITVKAIDEDDNEITGKTDENGKCVLGLIRTKTYSIETQIKDGYSSTSVQGRRYTVNPATMNEEYGLPEEFSESYATNANYGYHAGDAVMYDGKLYRFTAAHKTAWTGTDVTEVDYPKNEATFTYRKEIDETDPVTITLKMEYEGHIPIPYFNMGVYAGDQNAFNPTASLASGEIYGGKGGQGDSNGTLAVSVPRNLFCEACFPPLTSHNLPEKLYQQTVSDKDKTITQTYDSGIKWVCGETAASLKDGTAWKEFSIDEFPFDDEDDWVGNSECANTVNKVTYYHPKDHPLALIHVATDELISVRFDHTEQSLLAANTESGAPSTAQIQKFYHNQTPYNASYYIRPSDLTNERSSEVTQGRQWCTQNLLHKDVTTSTSTSVLSSYDGPWMTSMMKYDSDNWLSSSSSTGYVAASSPAAEYALSSTFEFGQEGTQDHRTLHGFIGTYTQMNPLFNLSQAIYGGLKKFGYVANFKTGTYWWSATQYSTTQSKLFTTSFVNANKNIITYNNVKTSVPCLFN